MLFLWKYSQKIKIDGEEFIFCILEKINQSEDWFELVKSIAPV